MTRQISEGINSLTDWVLVIASHCFQVVSSVIAPGGSVNCSHFPYVGKILKSFLSQISSICSR